MQTARWSESPGDMQRFGFDEGRVLSALVFDQDTLNDLLISTSVGSSVAPFAMRGSNMSRISEVNECDGCRVSSLAGCGSMQASWLEHCLPGMKLDNVVTTACSTNPTSQQWHCPRTGQRGCATSQVRGPAHQACCTATARALPGAAASAL